MTCPIYNELPWLHKKNVYLTFLLFKLLHTAIVIFTEDLPSCTKTVARFVLIFDTWNYLPRLIAGERPGHLYLEGQIAVVLI